MIHELDQMLVGFDQDISALSQQPNHATNNHIAIIILMTNSPHMRPNDFDNYTLHNVTLSVSLALAYALAASSYRPTLTHNLA